MVDDERVGELVGRACQLTHHGGEEADGSQSSWTEDAHSRCRRPGGGGDVLQPLALAARWGAGHEPGPAVGPLVGRDLDEQPGGVVRGRPAVRRVGAAEDPCRPPREYRGCVAREVRVRPRVGVVARPHLDDPHPSGLMGREGVGPHPGPHLALVVGRRQGCLVRDRSGDPAVPVEVADRRQHRSGGRSGVEQGGRDGRPVRDPAGVGGVRAVVDRHHVLGQVAHPGRVRRVGRHPLDPGVVWPGAGAGDDADLLTGLGESQGGAGAERTCSDDEVGAHGNSWVISDLLSDQ